MSYEELHAVRNVLSDKYAIYLRKSRADLELEAIGEGETLAKHKKILYALAEKHGIYPDQITVYQEIVSGESLSDRPEAQQLLDDVCAGKYTGVLVVEIERLARGNTKDQGEVAEAFQMSSTKIITPAKVYDPTNEFDEEYFEFGLFMSRREYKTIRRRLEAGKLQAVQEGNYLLPEPPFGFDVVRKSKRDRYLVEKSEESKYVKMIFDWYTEDRKPTSWIAKQLTLMGVPTRKKNKDWARATVKDILFNAHYIGMVSWGNQQTVKEKDRVTGKIAKKRKSTGDIKLFKGKHDGFISEEQFYKVRKIYGTNAPAKVNTELVNPLSGVLVCAHCGRAINYQSYQDNRIPRYHHPYGVHACKVKSLYATTVMDALVKALNGYMEDFEIRIKNNNANTEADRQQTVIATMEAELAKQERMKRRLFDSWEADDGTYTKEEFLERKQMYVRTIDRLQQEIDAAKKNVPDPIDYTEKILSLQIVIDCLNNPNISAKEKNRILKQNIKEIKFDAIDLGRGKGGEAVLDVHLK